MYNLKKVEKQTKAYHDICRNWIINYIEIELTARIFVKIKLQARAG